MHDQNSIDKNETSAEKYQRALDLFTESVMKPDHDLRSCGHNQGCYDELMEIRDYVLDKTRSMINPRVPASKFGEKNDHVEPTVETPNGDISETLMSGALGDYYMSEKREY